MTSKESKQAERDGQDEEDAEHRLRRRACLKMAGTLIAAGSGVSATSGRATAGTDGYGEGGYGHGGYGGSSDSSVTVSTNSPTNLTDSGATLNGSLDDLGGAGSADCYFEWRESGVSTWNTTSAQSRSSTGSFSEDITGLSSATEYEFRAFATASDGDTDTGSTKTFTTSSSDHAPTIDYYSVTEAGSPNPHAEITAEWDVGDADGDLAVVKIGIYDSDGNLLDVHQNSVSGSDATGTDKFTIKHVKGQTFHVVLTVTDAAGNSTSQTTDVTE